MLRIYTKSYLNRTMGNHPWDWQILWKMSLARDGIVMFILNCQCCSIASILFWLTLALQLGRPLWHAQTSVVKHLYVKRRLALYLAIELLTLTFIYRYNCLI